MAATLVTLVAAAVGCGSTSKVDTGASSSGAGAEFGQQICSGAGADKPGYSNGLSSLSGGASKLSGAGSTFVAPLMSVWTKGYQQTGNVEVAYQSIGSGGGVQQISTGTVDFGASDTPMNDSELSAAKGGPILHVPLVLGAVAPSYNLPGIKSGLKFTGDVLGKIYAGDIKTWNDPAIKKLNPGVKLPRLPIAVAHRSDGSGTTAVWTDYLTKESPTWVSKLGGRDKSVGKTVAWPVGIGGKGNEGVSGVINQISGGFGYIELAYAMAQNLSYGQVENKAGTFIQPCPATITAATNGVTYPADLRTSLTDGSDPNAYPITGTTFALIYTQQGDKATAAALLNFLSWVLTTGQDHVGQLHYAPLGKDLQQKAMEGLKKVTFHGQPLAP